MKNDNTSLIISFFLILIISINSNLYATERIQLTVENAIEGAPLTIGIPFPQGALLSPDHVRILDKNGKEIACQTNQVTTWEPVDYSVKWLWVFFFSTGEETYLLEYGNEVRKKNIEGHRIKIKNAQRKGQSSIVETGTLRFTINKQKGGFIDEVLFDVEGNGFDATDTIATSEGARGSFLDLLDDLGIDSSRAIIHRTVRERGSGPLHAILRLEGNYIYNRSDNRDAPFIIRIHVYAGKSYIRVFHTLTYTGIPDKHQPRSGQHACIALTDNTAIIDDTKSDDLGWMEANDQIASTGLSLHYHLSDTINYQSGYKEGTWSNPTRAKIYSSATNAQQEISVFQTGPKPNRLPPVPTSTPEKRINGFQATIKEDGKTKKKIARSEGWASLADQRWGIGIGIKNFLEEYPKEIAFDVKNNNAIAYLWSPKAGPMSFARASNQPDQDMISNFAEGLTKTSEVVLYFHPKDISYRQLKNTMDYFINPPIAHAASEVYANSLVYGHFSPRQADHLPYERALDYKFDWELFNQHWEPWYGMFDYGDQKNNFFNDDWHRWQNNEPAIDFMYWLQFMRTGDPKYYRAAEAMSRHTMDVDNIHWPTNAPYHGDTNASLDYWKWESKKSVANPYLGIGRRHAKQHWVASLSAHVWLQGWLASYYLTGYHRGLDIARLTADSYTKRIWGGHGLSGRRLYLSVWNLVETWDATKDPRYLTDLKDRVNLMLQSQNGPDQYDNLVIDRYGYSQVYASHGLYKYYQLTKEEKVRQALIRHARAVRDNPPYNHEYESYFATIHSLLVGYEFTKESSFLEEALLRSEALKTDKIKQSSEELNTQKKYAPALQMVSHLPLKGDFSTQQRWPPIWSPTNGLRVFGWTHIYNIPWLLDIMRKKQK